MFTVFVLGNIASGKSTACRYFESRGAMLIDLDELAKSLYVPDIARCLLKMVGISAPLTFWMRKAAFAAASSLLELSLLLIRSHGSMASCIPF